MVTLWEKTTLWHNSTHLLRDILHITSQLIYFFSYFYYTAQVHKCVWGKYGEAQRERKSTGTDEVMRANIYNLVSLVSDSGARARPAHHPQQQIGIQHLIGQKIQIIICFSVRTHEKPRENSRQFCVWNYFFLCKARTCGSLLVYLLLFDFSRILKSSNRVRNGKFWSSHLWSPLHSVMSVSLQTFFSS